MKKTVSSTTKSSFFEKEFKCPICKNKFKAKGVKISAIRPKKRDTDFYTEYEGVNPNFYSIYVCNNCFYAAYRTEFENISPVEVERIKKNLNINKEDYKDVDFYSDNRDIDSAIKSYLLALQSYLCRKVSNEKIAGIYLRCAWLYREAKNEELEKSCLEQALKYYKLAFEKEPLISSKFGEVGIIYLIGELNRRIGNYEEAIKWFTKVVEHPLIKTKPEIENLARDQWYKAREELKNE